MHPDPGLTVEAWSDKSSEAFFRARDRWGDVHAYELSWNYVVQAMRRGGWVCSSANGWAAVSRDYCGEGRSALLAPMADSPRSFVPDAITAAVSAGAAVVRVRHLAPETAEALVGTGLFSRPSVPTSACLDDLSEDTWPQVLIHLPKERWRTESGANELLPALPTGSALQEFRWRVRHFVRQHATRVHVRDLTRLTAQDSDHILSTWMKSVRTRFNSGARPPVRDFSTCFREPVESLLESLLAGRLHSYGEALFMEDRGIGIWLGDRISRSTCAVNVLLADTTIRDAADFALYRSLIGAHQERYEFVNLGGSESKSLFDFKRIGLRDGDAVTFRRAIDLDVH